MCLCPKTSPQSRSNCSTREWFHGHGYLWLPLVEIRNLAEVELERLKLQLMFGISQQSDALHVTHQRNTALQAIQHEFKLPHVLRDIKIGSVDACTAPVVAATVPRWLHNLRSIKVPGPLVGVLRLP
jgi:hypothetical protein